MVVGGSILSDVRAFPNMRWWSIYLQVIEELLTFDSHVNHSFSHKWMLPEEEDQYIHYTAPTYGVDANQTFDYAGILVFTDANVTRVQRESRAPATSTSRVCRFDVKCMLCLWRGVH